MSTYAVGDVQGCHRTLLRLLDRIAFDPSRDRLWLAGDLVNRGPASLEVLRWARDAGDAVIAVLGNHDLHLLALAQGVGRPRPRDSLAPVLEAPDREPLLEWLRTRPLLVRAAGRVMIHAGFLPSWTVADASAEATALERALARDPGEVLSLLESEDPLPEWSPGLTGTGRLRTAAAALTRLRRVTPEGRICSDGEAASAECMPWFEVPGRRSAGATMVFGHWSALGLVLEPNVIGLDTGCVWGGTLTAVRLEDRRVFQEPLADAVDPRIRGSG